MRLFRIVVVACALAALTLPSAQVVAQTPSAAELFNDGVLHEVRLFVNSRDLQRLRDRYLESITVPADLVWRNVRVRNAAIRLRGLGSRNPVKLGIEVSFDRYTKGQTFLGLTSLVIDNLWQDPSLFREFLGMKVFRQLGQAAPRESFARLYINNELQGVYGIIEPVDPRFATQATGESAGRLFEYRYTRAYYGEYLGTDLAAYKPLFASRSITTDSDSSLYGPIHDLFRDANVVDDVSWRQRTDAALDLPQFLAHIAIQGCLANNDGIMGYAGFNNFYLYRHANSNRHRIFPWDEDFGFQAVDWSIVRRGEQPVAFIDRAMAEPDLKAAFLDTAEACAFQLGNDGWLASEIDRLMGLVGPAILADTRRQFSNDIFLADVEFLRDFAVRRPDVVLAEANSLR